MKPIKVFSIVTFLTLSLFSFITFIACNKNGCQNISCKNGGSCSDGTCSCATGYKGKLCDELERDVLLGSYSGNTGASTYTITIVAGIGDVDFKINNFSNWGTATGYWTNSGSTIPEQSLGGGVTVRNGVVTISGTTIKITYEEYFSGMGGGTWISETFNGTKI